MTLFELVRRRVRVRTKKYHWFELRTWFIGHCRWNRLNRLPYIGRILMIIGIRKKCTGNSSKRRKEILSKTLAQCYKCKTRPLLCLSQESWEPLCATEKLWSFCGFCRDCGLIGAPPVETLKNWACHQMGPCAVLSHYCFLISCLFTHKCSCHDGRQYKYLTNIHTYFTVTVKML